jgi:hypothetical protein
MFFLLFESSGTNLYSPEVIESQKPGTGFIYIRIVNNDPLTHHGFSSRDYPAPNGYKSAK